MKRNFLLLVAVWMTATMWAATGINYDGNTLELNNEFTRTECGTMAKKTMKETSGMAASRQTPGYLWAHGDENLDSNRKLVAIKPNGTLTMTVNLTTTGSNRDDWEDICTGVYGGKNYVFVGAIGDNDLAFNDQYYIFYFEEPAITSGSTTITTNYIRFGYPDNKAHNTETLMYDNIEKMFYIADKVEGVCHLYKLPFRTDYGTGVQKLTEVCALGNGSVFNLCTGGDITPDGQWMAIKNKQYILLWERQGTESLSETAKRRPVQIAAYQEEAQGESLAWEDASTFYTTSDQKKDMPIYKYTREINQSSAVVLSITVNGNPLAGFQQDQLNYNIVLPYGTTDAPVVAATAANGAVVNVTQATSATGKAIVTCISKDGSTKVEYTITFSVSAMPNSDATLKSLSVNGTVINGFAANQYEYAMTIAYTAALPVVTAEANDVNAKVDITNVTEVGKTPSTATVVVTAQDNTTKLTYSVAFNRSDAVKKLNEVIMSNHYSAFIPANDSSRIQAYYLAGEDMPTIYSHSEGENTTWSQDGNVITLTGADGTTISYNLVIETVSPATFTAEQIVFDGSETWIKGAYGWDNTKKWKFSKTDTDYTREMNGKTHVELFLPACDTLVLTPNSGTERDVRIYVNGVEFGTKTKFVKAGLTLAVEQSAPFMLTIASAQTSGDGGVAAIRMTRKGSALGLNTIKTDERCTKIMRDGQIYLIYEGRMYDIHGNQVQ